MVNVFILVLKKHRRWASDKAKSGYVRENIKEKLTVSKSWEYNFHKYTILYVLFSVQIYLAFFSFERLIQL